MNRRFAVSFAVCFSFIPVFGLTTHVFAHAFHVSVAEAEVNHRTKRIEVALRLHPSDLERALEQMSRSTKRSYRRIQLEKEPKVDELILRYLQSSIQLHELKDKTTAKKTGSARTSKSAKLVWVGKEVDVKWAWLYFEIPIPKKGLQNATLSNKVFFELLDNQVNTIVLKDGKRKQTLSFDKSHGTRRIKLPQAAGAPSSSRR